LQLPVGVGGSMPTDGTCSHTGVGAQLELAGKQVTHAILVHHQHDQINGLTADLQAKASTFQNKEGRGAPAFWSAAAGNTASVSSAYNEAPFEHRGNDSYAFGRTQDFFRNTLIRRRLDFIEHLAGSVNAIHGLGVVFFVGKRGKDKTQ